MNPIVGVDPVLELDAQGFEILQAALRIARNGNVKRLSDLRTRLSERYPDDLDQIDRALATWAKYAHEHWNESD